MTTKYYLIEKELEMFRKEFEEMRTILQRYQNSKQRKAADLDKKE